MKDELSNKRAKTLNQIGVSLQEFFAAKALINKLSPLEMLSVTAAFSITLLSNVSEYSGLELTKAFDVFVDVMKSCLEEEN